MDQYDDDMRHAFPMNLVLDRGTGADAVVGSSTRERLVEQLRGALLAGQVAAGEPLPSTRALATAAGVSRGTVVAAYEELAGEGYVTVVPGSGTFVAEDMPAAATPTTRLGSPVSPGGRRPRTRPRTRATSGDDAVDLSPGSPAAGWVGTREWTASWRRAVKQDLPRRPPAPNGEPAFRAAVADHLRSARGVHCDPDDILVTSGTRDGLGLLAHALRTADPAGPRIATENPGHAASRRALARLGARPVPIRVRDGGMDVDELIRAPGAFAAALVTPSHQFPLGGRLPVPARLLLLDWAASTGACIIEDDYDSEFRHGAPPLPAIASLDAERRVVLVGTFSKTLSPSLRCGYLVVPDPGLRTRLLEARAALGQPVSWLVQAALADFLDSGGLRRHLARVGRAYAHRRAMVLAVAAGLAPGVELNGIEGGLHAALTWEAETPAEPLVAALADLGIAVDSLRGSYHGPEAPDREGIVFGYGAPGDLELRAALDRICEVIAARR